MKHGLVVFPDAILQEVLLIVWEAFDLSFPFVACEVAKQAVN